MKNIIEDNDKCCKKITERRDKLKNYIKIIIIGILNI